MPRSCRLIRPTTARFVPHSRRVRLQTLPIWKDLRTTFSTRLVDADMPESVNESLMGYSRGKVVNRRYALATWEKKVDAIRKLPRLLENPADAPETTSAPPKPPAT